LVKVRIAAALPGGSGGCMLDINAFGERFLIVMRWRWIARPVLAYWWL
jgi:hypothetical protein